MGPAGIVDAFLAPVLWLIALSVGFAVLQIRLLPRWRGLAGEAQVGRALQRLFPTVAHDVILHDDRGGLTQIDHLALAPAGILVVETKHYRGRIFGQANEATWTQAIGRRRHRFQNPLRQNHAHVRAVDALALGVPVLKRVVFTNAAEFPNGRCDGVSQLVTLDADLSAWRQGTISPALQHAWEQLLASARTDRASRRAHLAGLRARHGTAPSGKRWLALGAVPIIAALFLAGAWRPSSPPQRPVSSPGPALPVKTPPGPTLAAPRPVPPVQRPEGRPPLPAKEIAAVEWATGSPAGVSDSEACKEAIVATLISNTAESRRKRAATCGGPSSDIEP
jgi:hypothetical protein